MSGPSQVELVVDTGAAALFAVHGVVRDPQSGIHRQAVVFVSPRSGSPLAVARLLRGLADELEESRLA